MTDREIIALAIGRDPAMLAPNFDIPMFDPFTDANDDYAVLEWATNNLTGERRYQFNQLLWEIFQEHQGTTIQQRFTLSYYQIGSYARAALVVLPKTAEQGLAPKEAK